jgi:hypothetical protein
MDLGFYPSTASAAKEMPPARRRDDARLSILLAGFDEEGGVASSDEVIGLMRAHWRQPISMLARWIVTRQLVTFNWKTKLLLPLFQFERPRMTPREGVVDVVRTLSDGLDDEGIALWFVRPNAELFGLTPLRVVLADPLPVAEAAHAAMKALLTTRSFE